MSKLKLESIYTANLIIAMGMLSENLGRYSRGEAQAYRDADFNSLAEQINTTFECLKEGE